MTRRVETPSPDRARCLWFERLNKGIHVFTPVNESYIIESGLRQARPDFFECIGASAGGSQKHIHGKDGAVFWMYPIGFHDVIPDDNASSLV